MFLLNGKVLDDKGFRTGGVAYPAGWCLLAGPDELAAVGVVVVADPVRPDDRYATVSQNADGTFTVVPFPADRVAAAQAGEVRGERDRRLGDTDWLVSRHREEMDLGAEQSLSVDQFKRLLAYRNALRDVPGQAGFPSIIEWPSLD